MRRRDFIIAAGGVGLVSGCLGSNGGGVRPSAQNSPTSSEDTESELTTTIDGIEPLEVDWGRSVANSLEYFEESDFPIRFTNVSDRSLPKARFVIELLDESGAIFTESIPILLSDLRPGYSYFVNASTDRAIAEVRGKYEFRFSPIGRSRSLSLEVDEIKEDYAGFELSCIIRNQSDEPLRASPYANFLAYEDVIVDHNRLTAIDVSPSTPHRVSLSYRVPTWGPESPSDYYVGVKEFSVGGFNRTVRLE